MLQHATRIRCAALLCAGALAVHELRYLLAFGGGAHDALALQGHGYLAVAPPLLTGLLALAGAQLLLLLARASPERTAGIAGPALRRMRAARFARLGAARFARFGAARFARLGAARLARRGAARFARFATARAGLAAWLGASTVLFATYAAQETLEGALAPGHPAGVAGVLGGGGWLAIPVALVVGAAVALLLRGARAVLDAPPADPRAPRPAHPAVAAPPTFAFARTAVVTAARGLARHLAGRAPPATVRCI